MPAFRYLIESGKFNGRFLITQRYPFISKKNNNFSFIKNIDVITFYNQVSSIALTFPGTVASTSYGTPAFKVNKKLFARFKENGKTLVVYTQERDRWMKEDPATFFITEHYKNYPAMLIDLPTVKKKDLRQLLFASWQLRAPKSLLKNHK
jgi:hypothetical protein